MTLTRRNDASREDAGDAARAHKASLMAARGCLVK